VKNLTGHIESDGLVFLNASELPVWSYLDWKTCLTAKFLSFTTIW
jgi:hypothetical protein